MITFKDWLEVVDYRINETSPFGWSCYGEYANIFTYWDGSHSGVSSDIIFDLKTQVVYEITVHDFSYNRSYRLINPEYREAYDNEVKKRSADIKDVAYDDIKYIDLETDEDLLDKLTKIINYQTYDTRIDLPLDINREDLHKLMEEAHKRDITLNELINDVMKSYIDNKEKIVL